MNTEPTEIITRSVTLEGSDALWLDRNDVLLLATYIELNGGTLSHFRAAVGAMEKDRVSITDIRIGEGTDA